MRDDGEEVPAGEDGVVYFGARAGTPGFEYNHDPEKTRRPSSKGRSTLWDVGHLDADGYLYLTDRKLFMIVSGGVNIYPQEVEDVLVLHPAVADVAVSGVPEPEIGEEVKAVVDPPPASAAGPSSRPRSSPSAVPTSRTTSARARSTSPTRCPRGERQALQEGAARGLLGQLGPRRHLNLGRRRPHVGVPARRSATPPPKSSTLVIPTAATTGPISRLPTPTVPPNPIIHSAMTRPRTFSRRRDCSVVFSDVIDREVEPRPSRPR